MERNLETFLNTFAPMQRAKARNAMEMQIRVNGDEFMFRHVLIERRVQDGSKLAMVRGDLVLERPDGAFLDIRNATRTGLAYAAHLLHHDEAMA